MIFVTVGSQMPFDRLIFAVDDWAAKAHPDHEIFAQIGPGGTPPKNMRYVETMTPDEFLQKMNAAKLVITHAGMGTIITALEMGRRIIIFPRLGALRETRNDHQIATAQWVKTRTLVLAANTPRELHEAIEEHLHGTTPTKPETTPEATRQQLIQRLKKFIDPAGT